MPPFRDSLNKISDEFEAWTKNALSGAPVTFQELVTQTGVHESALKSLSKDLTVDLCIFVSASVGGFRAIDKHLRENSKGATQSIAFRRVDIWGRLKAFEILSEELAEDLFRGDLPENKKIKLSSALLREAKEISNLMMNELALRGELTRLAAFLEWITTASTKLDKREKAVALLAAG